MDKTTLAYYLERYATGTITTGEWQVFKALLNNPEQLHWLESHMEGQLSQAELGTAVHVQVTEEVVASVLSGIRAEQLNIVPTTGIRMRRWIAAAVVLLAIGTGAYLWNALHTKDPLLVKEKMITPADIAPGGNRAILTLSDGSTIVLDSAAIGNLASQGNTKIIKLDAGKLAYQGGAPADEIGMNTIRTPKGGQYQIVLPDGTKVWLNAASSVTFPTAFAKDRVITTTGEVYFEVTQDRTKPFIVKTDNVDVQVLGTRFNVNAYVNEKSLNTTLLEGSIAVAVSSDRQQQSPSGRPVILRPGQQAQLVNVNGSRSKGATTKGLVGQKTQPGSSGEIKVINNTDIDKVMAWKNGLFNFNGLTFEEIMRQLERWYDIQVVYENNNVPNKRLAGGMTRGVSLNGLLKYLGETGVRYKLEGRTLVVLP